ncbi:MAG: NADPH-dependent ferric siderophore reductase, partial [Streptococcus pyogenes]
LIGQPAVWAACEFHSMRALRHYFKVDRPIPKTHLYISSYWKVDSTEDQHKIVKREDAQSIE